MGFCLKLLCFAFFGAVSGLAQTNSTPPSPQFEVASIKPAEPPRPGWKPGGARGFSGTGGRLDLHSVSLMSLVTRAFEVDSFQVRGPAWLESRYFDISASAAASASRDEIPLMLRSLLRDRFGMKGHRETPTQLVYALVASAQGSRLQPGIPDDHPDDLGQISAPTRTQGPDGLTITSTARAPFGVYKFTVSNGVVHYEFQNITMRALAQFLSRGQGRGPLDLPVVDMTELRGRYMVSLDIPVNEMHGTAVRPDAEGGPVPIPAEPSGGSIGRSLEKQGIKLLRRNGVVERIVIDHIENVPTGN